MNNISTNVHLGPTIRTKLQHKNYALKLKILNYAKLCKIPKPFLESEFENVEYCNIHTLEKTVKNIRGLT